jgi:TM2 domain-containing membrane protein YozV
LAPTEATAEAKALAAALTGGATSSPKKVALASAKPQKLGIRKLLKIRKALKEAAKAPQGGKSQLTALLLCFFLGLFAVHRFYLGYTTQGILQILTVLCCGLGIIWVLIDFVRIIAGDLQPADGMYEIEL